MRPKVIQLRRLTRDEQRIGALLYPETGYWRPATRNDCAVAVRPCPYVGCRYNLYLDVDEKSGSIRLNYPDKEVWDAAFSCALDESEKGGLTLEEVGEIMGVTRERIRQIESVAVNRMKRGCSEDLLPQEELWGRDQDAHVVSIDEA